MFERQTSKISIRSAFLRGVHRSEQGRSSWGVYIVAIKQVSIHVTWVCSQLDLKFSYSGVLYTITQYTCNINVSHEWFCVQPGLETLHLGKFIHRCKKPTLKIYSSRWKCGVVYQFSSFTRIINCIPLLKYDQTQFVTCTFRRYYHTGTKPFIR